MADNGRSAQLALVQPPPTVLDDLSERVKLMEAARDRGIALIRVISSAVKQSNKLTSDVDNWSEISDELTNNVRDQSLLVGLCGETGLGKSTLINALLDKSIAPTSSVEACTAAVCVFAYNTEVDPKKAFRAKITFKSAETIRQELSKILEEMWEVAAVDAEDIDADVRARMATVKQNVKVIAGWSGMSEEAIQTAKSAQDIMKRSKHRLFRDDDIDPATNFLEEINAETSADLRKTLASYVQGRVGRVKKKIVAWPLVEKVQVFVKSNILKHGIKLVDLPGAMDALESRCAVSKQYMWNLNKRIVAVHANRATDSKTAIDLMVSSTDMMDMQLDGQCGRDSLAVVVNQIDNMDTTNAEEEWAEDHEHIRDLCEEMNELSHKLSNLAEQIQEAQEEIADLRASSDPEDEMSDDEVASTPQKRGREEGSHNESEALRELEAKLVRLKKDRDVVSTDRQQLETQLVRKCILARNERIIGNFARHSKESQHAPDLGPTNVFPNSARCYNRFKNGMDCPEFDDRESTGVDAVRRWIIEVSLPHREEDAKGHLQQLNILFDAADGWTRYSNDNTNNCRLSNEVGIETLEILTLKTESMSKDVLAAMEIASDTLTINSTLCAPRHSNGMPEDAGAQELDTALSNFARFANTSGIMETPEKKNKMAWVTYRKLLRLNGGEWATVSKKSKKGRIHNWMGSIYESFWGPFKDRWLMMHRQLRKIKTQLVLDVSKHFNAFTKQLVQKQGYSQDFRKLLKQEVYILRHDLDAFLTYIREQFRLYEDNLREHRATTKRVFFERMKPAFEKALQESGKGSHAKQLAIMTKHVSSLNPDMFKNTLDSLESKIFNDKVVMMVNIKKRWKNFTKAKMRRNLTRIVASVCPSIHTDNPDLGDLDNTVVKNPAMNEIIRRAIDEWRYLWAQVEPQLPVPEGGMPQEPYQELGTQLIKAEANESKNNAKKSALREFDPDESSEENDPDSDDLFLPWHDGSAGRANGGPSNFIKEESEL